VNPEYTSIPIRDIHLPDSVSWWPLAPGWWITLGLFLLAAAVVYLLSVVHKRQQLGKQTMSEYSQLVNQYQSDGDVLLLLTRISELMRRVSVTQFSHLNVAGLTGKAWLTFLDESMAHNTSTPGLTFSGELGEYLISAQYKKSTSMDKNKLDQLLKLSHTWLQHVCKKQPPERLTEVYGTPRGDG
jgi:hypothetical protein